MAGVANDVTRCMLDHKKASMLHCMTLRGRGWMFHAPGALRKDKQANKRMRRMVQHVPYHEAVTL